MLCMHNSMLLRLLQQLSFFSCIAPKSDGGKKALFNHLFPIESISLHFMPCFFHIIHRKLLRGLLQKVHRTINKNFNRFTENFEVHSSVNLIMKRVARLRRKLNFMQLSVQRTLLIKF